MTTQLPTSKIGSEDYFEPLTSFVIPSGISNLEDFCRWSESEDFPQQGRIDFIAGRIEVDVAPEELFSHGQLRTRIVTALSGLVDLDEDILITDSTQIVNASAGLSAEPDIVFIAAESVASGRVRLVDSEVPDRVIRIDGSPDMVAELVSDSSVSKDRVRLMREYQAAGVREYWLIDARRGECSFELFISGPTGFALAPADDAGFRRSEVFQRSFRLAQTRDSQQRQRYRLEIAD